MRSRIALFTIRAFAACRSQRSESAPSVPFAGCYFVVWPDTLGASRLPDSLRLTTDLDSSGRTSMFAVRPLGDQSPPWRPELRVAVWQPMGPASFDVVLATNDLQWEMKFQSINDSIDGEGQYAVGDALETFRAHGHQLAC